jgi:hypothetical protein
MDLKNHFKIENEYNFKIMDILLDIFSEKGIIDIILDYKRQIDTHEHKIFSILNDLIYVHKCINSITKIYKNKDFDIIIYRYSNYIKLIFENHCFLIKYKGYFYLKNYSPSFKKCYDFCKLCNIDNKNYNYTVYRYCNNSWNNDFLIWLFNIQICYNINNQMNFLNLLVDEYNLEYIYNNFNTQKYINNLEYNKFENSKLFSIFDKKYLIYYKKINEGSFY